MENQPRSTVTNFTCKDWIVKKKLFWTNSGIPTLTQATNSPQHGGGPNVQGHTLQKLETRHYETITKGHFYSTIELLKNFMNSRIN